MRKTVKKRVNLTSNRGIVVNLQTFTNSEIEDIDSARQKVSETTLKVLFFHFLLPYAANSSKMVLLTQNRYTVID